MELYETMEQGAARETREEAEAEIEIEQLYCMYNIPRIGQIYVLFKAQLKDGILVLVKKASKVVCLKSMKFHGENWPFLVSNIH